MMLKLLIVAPFFHSTSITSAAIPGDEYFKVETLSENLIDAMEMAILPNSDVLIAERTGALKRYDHKSGETRLIKQLEVSVKTNDLSRETGLLGITIDPDFRENGWLYCYYSPPKPHEHRLARFTLHGDQLSDEKILLHIPQSRQEGVCHEGGSLAFDQHGNLYLSTGDNTNPFQSDGYAPIDEQEGREHLNAQRTASNSNDLRGKILRIHPEDDGSYTIPHGNLFPQGTAGARPEIYVMGCRNPWRIGIDQKTGVLYWGEVGPDAAQEGNRGPKGYCEINQAMTAGYYGWPYFVADNKPYADYDFSSKKVGEKFDPAQPQNISRLNTGLRDLPPARTPLWFVASSCYCAGPVYRYDRHPDHPDKMPRALDGCLLTYDWNNGHMQLSKLAADGTLVSKVDWLRSKKFIHPSDLEIGPDGTIYLLEYGSVWYDGTDGKLKKITYTLEKQETQAEAPDVRLAGISPEHPGYPLLGEAICLSCHQTQVASIGPKYLDVAMRYRGDEDAAKKLIEKILQGGVGDWGEVPMPPHPQYNEEQLRQMVDAILSLAPEGHNE